MPSLADANFPPPLDWQSFERLLCDAASILLGGAVERSFEHSYRGEGQSGIDIWGKTSTDGWYGIQAKHKTRPGDRPLNLDVLNRCVEEAKSFTPHLAHFILAVTDERVSERLQKRAREL